LKDVSKSLTQPVEKIRKRSIPIYVTETGIAARNAQERDIFFKRYLYALHRAMQEGVNVRGYAVWSLMDNFEWSHGYTKKFGICSVDFETQERKLKKGTEFLINVVQANR
jgi:beta-glucosidase